jgi:hypothetical protein
MTHMCRETLVTVVNGQLPAPVIEATDGGSVIVNQSPLNITYSTLVASSLRYVPIKKTPEQSLHCLSLCFKQQKCLTRYVKKIRDV